MTRQRLVPWVLLAAVLASPPAMALLSGGETSPAAAKAAVYRPASLRVQWRMSSTAGPLVSSDRGVLTDAAGTVYWTREYRLQGQASGASSSRPVAVTLLEQVTVPASALSRAQAAGALTLYYQRDFVDGDARVLQLALPIQLTGAGGADFAIDYLELRFPGGGVREAIRPGQALAAVARIRFTGRGQLHAVWEVAGPDTAAGSPVFRPLKIVRAGLLAGQTARLQSPPLPTFRRGLHQVRLRILDPAAGPATPALQYLVLGEAQTRPLEILTPGPDATLSRDTRFRWRPLAGAASYRLEIQAPGGDDEGQPLTGMALRAERTDIRLPSTLFRHFAGLTSVRWRLVALDAQGREMGSAPWRTLRLAPASQTGGDADGG